MGVMSIKWFGGKNFMVKRLLKVFPKHTVYVEPFGGAAHLLFNKPKVLCEVYSDVDDRLLNLWTVIKYPNTREKLKNMLYFTPYSRQLYTDINNYTIYYKPVGRADVYHAWAMLVRLYCSMTTAGGTRRHLTQGTFGVAYQNMKPEKAFHGLYNRLDGLGERLRSVHLKRQDFGYTIPEYDSDYTLFYLDPPYLVDGVTRVGADRELYFNDFSMDDHIRLFNTLQAVKSKVVLSYYRTDFILNLYKSWNIQEVATTKFTAVMDKTKLGQQRPSATELIITNF